MVKGYDLIIVGAGPAGLQAASTAAQHGLKVVVIEKQRDVSKITRACCQQFIMDDGYENECIQLKDGKVIFSRNGFEIDYDGPTFNITDKYYISPHGHKIHFANKDKSPIAIKFDKGRLLQGIWEKCERLGVEFRSGTVAYDAKDSAEGVALKITSCGTKSTIRAKKLIIADGVNSRISEALGMNKDRTIFTTALGIIYMIEKVRDFESTTWKVYNGLIYHSKMPVIIGPSLLGENVMDLVIMGSKNELPEQVYHNFTTKSPLAYIFEKAEVVNKIGCGVKVFTSMRGPYRGNALVIGDAAAYVEVETQGGLMCGFQAGNAVFKELKVESGFEEYTKWWQDSFEFNSEEYLRVAQGYALVPTYSDDELDYLFALTEDEVLEGTFSQYRSPKLMWNSMLRYRNKIAKERPEIYEKIKNINKLTL